MRSLFVVVTLFALSLHAAAADPNWMEVAKAKDGESTFIDLNSVKSSGSSVMAWFRATPSKAPAAGKSASSKMRIKFDCSGERSTILSVVAYGFEGTIISNEQARFPENGWQDVVPGSIGQSMMEAACALAPAT